MYLKRSSAFNQNWHSVQGRNYSTIIVPKISMLQLQIYSISIFFLQIFRWRYGFRTGEWSGEIQKKGSCFREGDHVTRHCPANPISARTRMRLSVNKDMKLSTCPSVHRLSQWTIISVHVNLIPCTIYTIFQKLNLITNM